MASKRSGDMPTYSLSAREYAFWLGGMFWSGLVLGLILGGWLW